MGGVLCFLGSKPLGAYALGDRSQHHPPLIPASQCRTGGPCYARLPFPGCRRRDRQTVRVLTGGKACHIGQT